eukprot:CAMPEP_0118973566 /NCGR_PEP_ID=MMETSP1173-20130426/10439_1 /TAXON_ID=1034831 /ORGANISM="Rhizochromulina marina cf, Strain CCMP1243" /LENGTH=246 /DNA_ID=CAMNT_0006923245 /DNA_START=6 /DNA_END=746 /DNA_ORIENTATION=+
MMKLVLALALFVGSVSAYTTRMTPSMARGRFGRAPAKKAAPVVSNRRSEALPWSTAPPSLDGSLVGDVGFDPFRLSANPEYLPFESLDWYREAELQHGRVAQLAFLGFIWPSVIGTLPSDEAHNFGELDPLAAINAVPQWGLFQIALVIGALEGQRYLKCIAGDNAPGDVGLGQGGFNPFNFNYSEEEYKEKQLQEIKHCRLAMFGILGAWWQNIYAGKGVIQQLGESFVKPEFVQKAGYYFPDGL